MSASVAETSRPLIVELPESTATQVEKMAREENRSTGEVLREAFRLYELEVARNHIRAAKRRAGSSIGREDEIQAYVDEIRNARNRDKVA